MASSKRGSDRDNLVPDKTSKRRLGESKRAEIRAIGDMFVSRIESLFRDVVRQELPLILQRHQFPSSENALNRAGTSGGRGRALQLCFNKKLPNTIFTFSKVVAEDGAPLQIALHDASSQYSIVKDGPLSSLKIEICVLRGDFGSNGSDDWTAEEFSDNIQRERPGKGPLLNGDRFIKLKNGVGCINRITLTDNSRCSRSGKFRLGAKIVQPTSDEVNIREGRSETFVVKDNRGECKSSIVVSASPDLYTMALLFYFHINHHNLLPTEETMSVRLMCNLATSAYRKHDLPSLSDEIWRLSKIAKDGKRHKQLSSHGIKTVKDLLQWHITNPHLLKEIFGKIGKKSWETLIDHAKACVIEDDGKRYSYQTAEQPIVLLLNSIYEVVEVTFDGQHYLPIGSLDSEQKRLVETVQRRAYKNVKDIKLIETSPNGLENKLAGLQAGQSGVLDQGLQQFDFPTTDQGFCEASTSKSHIGEAVHNEQVGTHQLRESLGEVLLNRSAGGGFFPEWSSYGDENEWALYLDPFYSACDDGGQHSYHSSHPNSAVYMSSKGNGKSIWFKIRNALKLIMSVA